MTSKITGLLLAIASLFLSACSQSLSTNSSDSPAGAKPPLRVEISQAFKQDGRVHLKVLLTALTDIAPSRVGVAVRGMNAGRVVEEQVKKLPEVFSGPMVRAGESVALSFVMQGVGVGEFQVQCSWGDEVAQLSQNGAHTEGLRVENIRMEEESVSCESTPCEVIYSVSAELVNEGGEVVDDAHLGVSVRWDADAGEGGLINGGTEETSADLHNLDLAPGERQEVNVRIDQPLPLREGGRYTPLVRLLAD